MNFLGIDPDCHHIGIALVDENLRIVRVGQIRRDVTKVGDEPKGYEAIRRICLKLKDHVSSDSPTENLMHESYKIVAAAVEGNMVYAQHKGSHLVDPNDIKMLATVSGACYILCMVLGVSSVYIPSPQEWKGQSKKFASHWGILTAAKQSIEQHWVEAGTITSQGDDRRYFQLHPEAPWDLIPGQEGITPGNWKHVLDAVGLAQYAAKTWKAEQRKAELLDEARSGL